MQEARISESFSTATAAIVIGCLFFFVGGTLGVFASQEFATGTGFMQALAGIEQVLGLVLIAVGWMKVRSIKAELDRQAPSQATKAFVAGQGS